MSLKTLTLSHFRNYNKLDLDDLGMLNIFIGPNAVGKTSIIEAIQLLTALKSFRTAQSSQMVQWGEDQASVSSIFAGDGRKLEEKLQIEDGKRRYFLNGKKKSMGDLKGMLPAVTFCPDDLHLAKGPHSARLTAIDDVGTQLSKNFYAVKKDYTKLVRQRNQALKDELPDAYIDSIDEVLVKVGVQYLSHRMFVISRLKEKMQRFYEDISNNSEPAALAYISSWDKKKEDQIIEEGSYGADSFDKVEVTEKYNKHLALAREEERARQKTVVGPHADHIFFLLDGKNAMHYASQGQQRTLILALKLAESALLQEILHQRPVLLLDDVMSELDEYRRSCFMEFISEDIQTFITTTNSGYFSPDIMANARTYSMPFDAPTGEKADSRNKPSVGARASSQTQPNSREG